MREGMRTWRVLCLGVVAFFLVGSPAAHACSVYDGNVGAGAWTESSSQIYDGLRGTSYLPFVANPAVGNAVAHPAQLGFLDGDFIGLGTHNGGDLECADHYGNSWQGYVDGKWNGVYHCVTLAGVTESAGADPAFVMRPSASPSECPSSLWWVMVWRGSPVLCVTVGSSSAYVISWGGEGTYQYALNVDVEYRSMRRSISGDPNWVYLKKSFSSYGECAEAVLNIDYVATGRWRIYKPPWGS